MFLPYVILALIGVPLLGFAAGVYREARKGRTLGEGAQVGCAIWMLVLLVTIVTSLWLIKKYPDWFRPPV